MSTHQWVPNNCECCREVTRRTFLKTTSVAAATVAVAGPASMLAATPARKAAAERATSENLAATLYNSLSDVQRKAIVFPFDHPLRSKVDNNWNITDKKIFEFFTKDQQAMIREIFTGLHSPEYAERVLRQVEHDGGKEGFGGCSIALFGEPGTGKFEFVLTGRHVTRRCDGDSVEGAAFGGPIFYGHAAKSFNEAADHPGNIYWYQARRANEVFKMLDGKQRELALLDVPREEKGTETVRLTGRTDLPGLPVGALARDQKQLVRKVMADVLAPFRKADADEALKLIERNGFDHLHMSFYKHDDIGNDGVWDVWQIEGPAMLWYFRGAPHVHTWVHIRETA
ncbi:MAG: DUF3500 domain-containing protein [Verrucomicrobia bacterium]|nr:MAG: DUF3500 domain-containing protein [Verrucomicrobiota bacterium]